jgi:N-acetylneuraminic acid mutarotase
MKTLILFPFLLLLTFQTHAQWLQDRLSEPKVHLGGASSWQNPHFWFAGGYSDEGVLSTVELYDEETQTWYISQLSDARSFPAVVVHNGKVYFAGGVNFDNALAYATVDVANDVTSGQDWQTTVLSTPRFSISAAAHGDRILFAGGASLVPFTSLSTVDIYRPSTNTWSVQALSEPRAAMGSGVVLREGEALAIFAGGFDLASGAVSDRVDIYHFDTDTWTTTTLSEPRCFVASTVAGNKLLIAGGMRQDNTPSDRVDIYDPASDSWSTATLSQPRAFIEQNAATACGKAYFAGGGTVDLTTQFWESMSNVVDGYDAVTGTWFVYDPLSDARVNHVVISNGSRLMVAGGLNENGVLRDIDVLTCAITSSMTPDDLQDLQVMPNPASGNFLLRPGDDIEPELATLEIMDMHGRVIATFRPIPADGVIHVDNLASGMYVLRVRQEGRSACGRIVIE